jgi:orotate phosphoribosyltransferase
MRSKDCYELEVRDGANPFLMRHVVEESFRPLPPSTGNAARAAGWSVDMRLPLSKGSLLGPVVMELISVLERHNICQIAGAGFGAFFLIGGILAEADYICGGLIRPSRKDYGFRRYIEGDLDRARPIFIIDDVLSSGSTALNAAAMLHKEGFQPAGVLTVLRLGWQGGDYRLRQAGLDSKCLATLFPVI